MLLEVARQKLSILAQAQASVELGPVGFAALVTEQCQAYRDLSADPHALVALKDEIETLARSGPGARRIYAALLLRTIDAAAGTAELEAMRDSDERFDFALGGCTVMPYTLAQAAAHFLGRP